MIKMEDGKESSGVCNPLRWVMELSIVSICSVVGGGDGACSNVAIGAYTGLLITFGCTEDVVAVIGLFLGVVGQ